MPPGIGQLKNPISLILEKNQLSGPLPFDEKVLSITHIVVSGNPQLSPTTWMLQNLSFYELVSTSSRRKLKHGKILIGSHGSSMRNSGTQSPAYVASPKTADTNTSTRTGAIIGGVVGAVVLVLITLVLVCMSLLRTKRYTSRQSETGSSDHSAQVAWAKHPDSPLVGRAPLVSEVQTARRFSLAELEHATKQWNPANLIGVGGFGMVYKGLLEDGTIVAIKKKTGIASQEFAAEVGYLAHVRHKHLVILIGFCQENDQQMVVYDYLPNGSVSSHLFDADGRCLGEIDFKQRLSISLGAAKGLEHLHALVPPLIHTNFKTSNVLVDENFVSKVTDYGLSRLLTGRLEISPSTSGAGTAGFQDPEFLDLQIMNEKSDVFSFGVFLLELISGREAFSTSKPRLEWNLVEWARLLLERRNLGALVDDTLGGNFTEEGIKSIMELSFKCIELTADRRPSMKEVVRELEKILEKETGHTSGVEGSASVTLGSELFLRTA